MMENYDDEYFTQSPNNHNTNTTDLASENAQKIQIRIGKKKIIKKKKATKSLRLKRFSSNTTSDSTVIKKSRTLGDVSDAE